MAKEFLQERLVSLDVFRGITVAAMILVNNSEGGAFKQLIHSPGNGWTIADTVFPFFLWAIGVAIVFSLGKKRETGRKEEIFTRVLRRSVILFVLGLFLNAFPAFELGGLRVMGVLQRIAVCYLISAILFLTTSFLTQVVILLSILIFYWLIIALDPNIVSQIDNLLLKGHLLSGTWDPEGIVSTVSAVTTVLFGLFTGKLLIGKIDKFHKLFILSVSGILLVLAGNRINTWMPINKNLWTTSYSIFMAGLAMLFFALLFFLIDIKGWKSWAKPWVIYGVNPFVIYMASSLFTKILWSFNLHRLPFFGPETKAASLSYAVGNVLLFYGLAFILYRKKWILKI